MGIFLLSTSTLFFYASCRGFYNLLLIASTRFWQEMADNNDKNGWNKKIWRHSCKGGKEGGIWRARETVKNCRNKNCQICATLTPGRGYVHKCRIRKELWGSFIYDVKTVRVGSRILWWQDTSFTFKNSNDWKVHDVIMNDPF